MSFKKVSLALVAAAATFAAVSAHAADKPSVYIGAGVSQSHISIDASGLDKNATGGFLTIGTQFHENFGFEVSVQELGSFDTAVGSLRGQAIGLQAVGYLPVTKELTLVAKPGVFQTQLEAEGFGLTKTVVGLGLGAEYALTKQISLTGTVQYLDNFAISGTSLTSAQFGVKYGF